jgi:hypothetical protein
MELRCVWNFFYCAFARIIRSPCQYKHETRRIQVLVQNLLFWNKIWTKPYVPVCVCSVFVNSGSNKMLLCIKYGGSCMKNYTTELYLGSCLFVARMWLIYLIYFHGRQPLVLERWAGCLTGTGRRLVNWKYLGSAKCNRLCLINAAMVGKFASGIVVTMPYEIM